MRSNEPYEANTPRRAVVSGLGGQDASFLVELLTAQGCEVHGVVAHARPPWSDGVDNLGASSRQACAATTLHPSPDHEQRALRRLLTRVEPSEVYVLATNAGEHPIADCNASVLTVTHNWLRAIRDYEAAEQGRVKLIVGLAADVFGAGGTALTEASPTRPDGPQAVAMAGAWDIVIRYREIHGLHASTAILFDHESERQSRDALSRQVTRAATRIRLGLQPRVSLGTLDLKREWGYAADHVAALPRMAQQDSADDYVIATGDAHTTRGFVNRVFSRLGLDWRHHVEELGNARDTSYFVERSGNASKARSVLGWHPDLPFDVLVERMINYDIALARREKGSGGLKG